MKVKLFKSPFMGRKTNSIILEGTGELIFVDGCCETEITQEQYDRIINHEPKYVTIEILDEELEVAPEEVEETITDETPAPEETTEETVTEEYDLEAMTFKELKALGKKLNIPSSHLLSEENLKEKIEEALAA